MNLFRILLYYVRVWFINITSINVNNYFIVKIKNIKYNIQYAKMNLIYNMHKYIIMVTFAFETKMYLKEMG